MMRSAANQVFAAIVAIAAAAVMFGCAKSVAPEAAASPSPGPGSNVPNIASVTAHGAPGKPITTSYIVNSHPVYVLRASSVTYLPNRSQGTFSDNHLIFYKGTTPRLTVSAPSAVLNLKTYDVVLRGGVKATSATGDVLKADQIEYVGTQHQLLASGNVIAVDAAGTEISGDRAIADLDLQEVKIFGHITMTGGGR